MERCSTILIRFCKIDLSKSLHFHLMIFKCLGQTLNQESLQPLNNFNVTGEQLHLGSQAGVHCITRIKTLACSLQM